LKPLFAMLSIAVMLGGFATAFHYGGDITFAHQWPLYEALRSTAAIIFAVVGAWYAIIFPERMRGIFRGGSSIRKRGEKGIEELFSPIVHSTIILCLILFVGVLAPILKEIPLLIAHTNLMRKMSFGVLTVLTIWQIWTVLATLIPALVLKETGDEQNLVDDNNDSYMSNKTVEDPDD